MTWVAPYFLTNCSCVLLAVVMIFSNPDNLRNWRAVHVNLRGFVVGIGYLQDRLHCFHRRLEYFSPFRRRGLRRK